MATRLTRWLRQTAWDRLQAAIRHQLTLTPGEFDFPALVDRVSRRMVRDYEVEYSTVAYYLENRYKDEG
jgi:hypothetical protein